MSASPTSEALRPQLEAAAAALYAAQVAVATALGLLEAPEAPEAQPPTERPTTQQAAAERALAGICEEQSSKIRDQVMGARPGDLLDIETMGQK